MNLLIFFLVCWGMTQILVYGEIFDAIRPRHKFFHCTMCVGFHVGWVVYLLFWSMGLWADQYQLQWAFISGCMSSAVSKALCDVFDNGIIFVMATKDPEIVVAEPMSDEEAIAELKAMEIEVED